MGSDLVHADRERCRTIRTAGHEEREMTRDRPSRGFSLIEVLVVLVVLAIVSSIVIPALFYALNRGRQIRTVADLRLLGGRIEAYSVDHGWYPTGSDVDALDVLVPEYTDHVTKEDAWEHQLIYNGGALNYSLGSAGKDGGNTLIVIGDGGPTKDFDADIIFSMGSFVQWPEGTQE
jgi:general secretion pathway protein G